MFVSSVTREKTEYGWLNHVFFFSSNGLCISINKERLSFVRRVGDTCIT